MYVTHEVMRWLKAQVFELERLRLGMEFNNDGKSLKQVMNLNLRGGHQEDQSFVSGSAVKEDQNLIMSKDSKELGELLNHEDFKSRFFYIESRFSEVVEEIEKLRAYTHKQIGDIEGELNNHESRLFPIEDKLQTLKAITPRWVFDSQTGISLVVDEIEKLRAYTDEQIGEIGGEMQNHESKFVPIEDELQILKAENELGKSRFFKVESMLAGAMEEMEKLKASTQQINEIESEVMNHKSQLDPIKVALKMLYEASEMARNSYWKPDGEMEKLEAQRVELERILVRFGGAAIYKSNTSCSNDVPDLLNKIGDAVMNHESNLVSIEDEVQVLRGKNQESKSRYIELESKFSNAMEEMGKLKSSTQEIINFGCKVKNNFWKLEDDMHAKFNDAHDLINKIKVEVINLKSKLAPIEDEVQVLKEENEEAKSKFLELESKFSNAMEEMEKLRSSTHDEIINIECKLMGDHKSKLASVRDEVQVLKAEKEEVEKRLNILEMRYPKVLRCGEDKLLRRLLLLSLGFGTYCYHFV